MVECRYASPVAATDPALWTTTHQVAAIRRRELGSVELLDAQLARIGGLDRRGARAGRRGR